MPLPLPTNRQIWMASEAEPEGGLSDLDILADETLDPFVDENGETLLG